VPELLQEVHALGTRLGSQLAGLDSAALPPDDQRALGIIRQGLMAIAALQAPSDVPPPGRSADPAVAPGFCRYDQAALIRADQGEAVLSGRIMACYAHEAQNIRVAGTRLDRLTILSLLATTDSRAERRRFFLALDPVWRAVNGDGRATSPWRTLTRHRVEHWRSADDLPQLVRARGLGLPLDTVSSWLTQILDAWRVGQPDTTLEPWDYYYVVGAASRRLAPRIPREQLQDLTRGWYGALGADLDAMRLRYDLEPRPGKTAVAFTDFGARPHRAGEGWDPGEPWVFATYRVGGLDNLVELLHETGHGVHIASIRTRPAYADWPDSDTFTEALADLVSLEAYDPLWQLRMLGDSAPRAEGLRGKYGGVVLDVAWSLFEIRMFKDPTQDPNQVWSGITSQYLRIKPHPELSWWAMRGQLVESPGYMLNYGLGSVLTAQLRARIRALRGDWVAGDPGWYRWVRDQIYRFGLERPTSVVLRDFLGAALSPDAILADLRAER